MVIESVIDDLAVGIARAPVHGIATSNPHSTVIRIWIKLPFRGKARFCDIHCDQIVREWRHHIQRAIDHQRLTLMSVWNARFMDCDYVQVLYVLVRNLIEGAVTQIPIVARRHRPLTGSQRRNRLDARQRSQWRSYRRRAGCLCTATGRNERKERKERCNSKTGKCAESTTG
jgi:hypothetical protein